MPHYGPFLTNARCAGARAHLVDAPVEVWWPHLMCRQPGPPAEAQAIAEALGARIKESEELG